MIKFLKSELFAKFMGGFVVGTIGFLTLSPALAGAQGSRDGDAVSSITQVAASADATR
ncbi:hypothetical protein PX699_09825 [Sphingobium sp. H39-3-25]|uniref:hypothetical protein n=1 Tax=Sphingobium arseniciresistens TaxID=3030834 RepID=UPI0023BA1A2E|nr:hypothetical protein [Sphingobium arseniciresistens]